MFKNVRHAERLLLKAVRNSLTSRLFQPDTGRLKYIFRSSNLHLNTPTASKQPTQDLKLSYKAGKMCPTGMCWV